MDEVVLNRTESAVDEVVDPSVAEPAADAADLSSVSLSTSVAETPVLFQSTAQPDQSINTLSSSANHQNDAILDSQGLIKPPVEVIEEQPQSSIDTLSSTADHQNDGILDSQGLIKPPVEVIEEQPQSSAPSPVTPSSAGSKGRRRAPPSRISHRTPAVIPEALIAAASRKPTSPALISGKPRPPTSSSSPVPMNVTPELKRKAQTQADALPKEKRDKKKKGRK